MSHTSLPYAQEALYSTSHCMHSSCDITSASNTKSYDTTSNPEGPIKLATSQRPKKAGFRFESYTDFVMGPSDDGFDYEDELDNGQPPLTPTTMRRIMQKVWNVKK